MTRPVVSVVMISYSTRELILHSLKTLTAVCTAISFEIIVVDNASTDGSADAIAAQMPDVWLVRLTSNVGFGRAVNVAAKHARGDWLLLLNPDTEPVGDVIAAFVDAAVQSKGDRLLVGRTLREDGSDDGRSCMALPTIWGTTCFAIGVSTLLRRSRLFNPDELPGVDRAVPAHVPAASGCALFIERALFATLDGFTEDYFMYSEDVDLCARAGGLGVRPLLVPSAKVIHVGGASSSSGGKRVMVLRGQTTYFRLRWSRPRAALGRGLLLAGIGLRAAGSRATGRAGYWREAWRRRSEWLDGWPTTVTRRSGS